MEAQRRFSRLQIIGSLFLVAAVWWYFFRRPESRLRDEQAEPRPVAALGDLAQDEKTATEIFRNVSRSVVYINRYRGSTG